MTHNISRRSLIKAAPVAALAVTLPATAITTGTDAVIEAAWQRRQATFAEYNALGDEWGQDPMHPEEARLWGIIDGAEEVIRSTVTTTPRGVAIQLWTALCHSITDRVDDAAATRGDLAHFYEIEQGQDWNARLVLAALRSLEGMGTAL